MRGEELIDYCRGKIAHYKVPRYWRVTDQFPMTVSGKVQKYKLREMALHEREFNDPTLQLAKKQVSTKKC